MSSTTINTTVAFWDFLDSLSGRVTLSKPDGRTNVMLEWIGEVLRFEYMKSGRVLSVVGYINLCLKERTLTGFEVKCLPNESVVCIINEVIQTFFPEKEKYKTLSKRVDFWAFTKRYRKRKIAILHEGEKYHMDIKLCSLRDSRGGDIAKWRFLVYTKPSTFGEGVGIFTISRENGVRMVDGLVNGEEDLFHHYLNIFFTSDEGNFMSW